MTPEEKGKKTTVNNLSTSLVDWEEGELPCEKDEKETKDEKEVINDNNKNRKSEEVNKESNKRRKVTRDKYFIILFNESNTFKEFPNKTEAELIHNGIKEHSSDELIGFPTKAALQEWKHDNFFSKSSNDNTSDDNSNDSKKKWQPPSNRMSPTKRRHQKANKPAVNHPSKIVC